MSIKEILEKGKPFYYLFFVLVIAGVFFAVGRLSSLPDNHTPIKIEYVNATSTATVTNAVSTSVPQRVPFWKSESSKVETTIPTDGPVIGSKSGKKYYFPWCGTVKRILPQNQVHFTSIAEARKAGFVPGGNCKGLK